ncbi:zinc finger protein 148-like isoform X1 [Vespula squamosa]|uniref:Zinc finger protein 148-like isoform X1 n=1 Tax=Vespula squamosa TaxID=30214 RepID=A0ABD2AQ30_VESSQ
MSDNNLLQTYNYETNNFEETLADYVGSTQYDENEIQFSRPVQDEVISVYEVYVKEETEDNNTRDDLPIIPSLSSSNDHQLIQGDTHAMNMDTSIDSEVIKVDSTVGKLLGKDALKYKILEQCISTNDNNVVVYSHPVTEGPSSSSTRMIDKDDIRSRLHFVKYLKRDGKTLKIWECGIFGPQAGLNDQNIMRNKNVRIVQLPGEEGNQMPEILSSTGTEDLRTTEKNNSNGTKDLDNIKSIQIRMPLVNSVIQKIESDGKSRFAIDSGSESHQGLSTSLDAQFTYSEHIGGESHRSFDPSTISSADECNELLDLAAQGGIQFVRATEDGRYEVMTSNEARDLMVQNSHDMAILNSEESDAINVINLHNNNDIIIGDADNQIMVLNSNSTRKQIPMDSIEILEDKDIRILESKSLDDRFIEGLNFLPQSKIDDFILGSKSLGIDHNGINITEHDDEGLDVISNHHDFANILNHRNDIAALSRETSASSLYKNHPSTPIINNTLSYLKANQSISEDMTIINNSTIQDHAEYDTKMKLPMVFDENDHNTGIVSLNHPEIKILDSGNQATKTFGNNETLSPLSKIYPNFGEVKILGPKNHGQELVTTQFQDMKMFSPYEDLLKNSIPPLNMRGNSPNNVCKKEVKILGKKLGIIGGTEDDKVIKLLDDKRKLVLDKQDACNHVDNGLTSPSSVDKPITENVDQNCFSLQVCSPHETKFMKSKNPLIGKGSSPDVHFNETRDISNNNNNNNNNNSSSSSSNDSYTNCVLPDLDS